MQRHRITHPLTEDQMQRGLVAFRKPSNNSSSNNNCKRNNNNVVTRSHATQEVVALNSPVVRRMPHVLCIATATVPKGQGAVEEHRGRGRGVKGLP